MTSDSVCLNSKQEPFCTAGSQLLFMSGCTTGLLGSYNNELIIILAAISTLGSVDVDFAFRSSLPAVYL